MDRSLRSLAPALVAGAAGVMAVAAVVMGLSSLGWSASLSSYIVNAATIGLALAVIGALVLREHRVNVIGWILSVAGLWATLEGLCAALAAVVPPGSDLQLAVVMIQGVWPPPVFLFLLVPHLYPHGHLMSPRWRVPFAVTIAAAVTSTLAIATWPHAMDDWPGLANPIAVPLPAVVADAIMVGGAGIVVVMAVVAVIGQVLRMRRAERDDQARIAWLLTAVLLMILALVIPSPGLALLVELVALASLGIGIVRYQLFDIERVLTRSLVYAIVIGAALASAFAVAAVVGRASDVGALPALAAASTAIALATAFNGIRRFVDRLLFGERNDPARALAELGTRLAQTPAPDDVVPTVVVALREALRLPYAGLTLQGEDRPASWSGEAADRYVTFPLRYGGEQVGRLELGLRRGERELSVADQRLVATFAAQAGAAAHSAQVTRELRRSRERIVLAHEEGRRMIRRELHDGIGPTLAGMALGLQTLLRDSTTETQEHLARELLEQARGGLAEVRQLARDLRPPVLDELGLADAVRLNAQTTERMCGGRPEVHVVVEQPLPRLPAAVEMAAYRIVQEGVTNVVRHAQASVCKVRISAQDSLVVRVDDNGSGLTPLNLGEGLRSMRERAEELGGGCTVTFKAGAGTSVLAVLPLHSMEDAAVGRIGDSP